jgi:hypothetical protein
VNYYSPPAEPPAPGRRGRKRTGRRRGLTLTIAASVLAVGCLWVCFAQVRLAFADAPQPETTAAPGPQPVIAVDDAWEAVPATTLFPTSVDDTYSGIGWNRVALAPPATCAAALTSGWSGSGCQSVLRATYVDQARSMIATVAVIVTDGQAVQFGINLTNDQLQPPPSMVVQAVAAPGTVAANWRTSAGIALFDQTLKSEKDANFDVWDDYNVVVQTGSLDGRTAGNLPKPWAAQTYGDKYDLQPWLRPADSLSYIFGTQLEPLLLHALATGRR